MIEFDEELVKERVLRQGRSALVEFWAPWCVYSLLLKPKTEFLARRFAERILVGRLNVESHKAVVTDLGIEYVPGIAFFHGGQLVKKWYGDTSIKEMTDFVEKYKQVTQ